ncbi:hypothetical protein OF83DRAFT_1138990 [Amylostereum chailletii]|nr:hypothetical protein OF83DRAFT_1138990 [Amylostereum chailletii]
MTPLVGSVSTLDPFNLPRSRLSRPSRCRSHVTPPSLPPTTMASIPTLPQSPCSSLPFASPSPSNATFAQPNGYGPPYALADQRIHPTGHSHSFPMFINPYPPPPQFLPHYHGPVAVYCHPPQAVMLAHPSHMLYPGTMYASPMWIPTYPQTPYFYPPPPHATFVQPTGYESSRQDLNPSESMPINSSPIPAIPAGPSHALPRTMDASPTTLKDKAMSDALLPISQSSASGPSTRRPPSVPAPNQGSDNGASAPPKTPKPSPALQVPGTRDFLALFWRHGNRMSKEQFDTAFSPYMGRRRAWDAISARLEKYALPSDDGGAFLREEYCAPKVERKRRGWWHPLRNVRTAIDSTLIMEIVVTGKAPTRQPRRFERDTSSLLLDLADDKKAFYDAEEAAAQKQLLNPRTARRTPRKPSPHATPPPFTMSAHDSPSRAHLRRARKEISQTNSKVVRYFHRLRSTAFLKVWLPIFKEIALEQTSPAPRTTYKIETSLMGIKLESSTMETTPDGETVCVVNARYLDV